MILRLGIGFDDHIGDLAYIAPHISIEDIVNFACRWIVVSEHRMFGTVLRMIFV